ncbi:MAG: peptidoglycan DD-metalloendopeptidase family protein [Bacteroidetes bacterium]|nr:peptidoglycan DD-metalloendopeptidase family protein [Bacteroidota bacterium]
MKNGSVTDKGLGDMVETGEYLGTVGSSGNSTGPHLHFEVYDADDNLIDPYIGTCNDWNLETWWADQPEYIAPEINRLQTHTAPPEFTTCPELVITNEQNNFMPGEECYFALYAKDLSASDLCHLRITKADGSIWYDWNFNQPADYYVASFWYWFYNIPADAPEGVWTWSCELDGVYYEHEFIVGELPISVENVNPLQHATANYANGNIQINLNNTESVTAEISVVNMLGQNISPVNSIMANVSAVTNIAVDNVEAGCYFVVINCNNQITSIPVMLHE